MKSNLGLGKLASIMANKGQGLMSEQTWNELHSEPTTEYDASLYCKKELIINLILLNLLIKLLFFNSCWETKNSIYQRRIRFFRKSSRCKWRWKRTSEQESWRILWMGWLWRFNIPMESGTKNRICIRSNSFGCYWNEQWKRSSITTIGERLFNITKAFTSTIENKF